MALSCCKITKITWCGTLLDITLLSDENVKIYQHCTLNYYKGVVFYLLSSA